MASSVLSAIAAGPGGPPVKALTPAEAALQNAQVGIAQQQIQAGALDNQQRILNMQDSALTRLYIQKHNGNVYEAINDPDLQGQIQPATALAFQKTIIENQDKLAETAQKHAQATQAMAAAQKSLAETEADQSYAIQQSGYNLAAAQTAIIQWQQHGMMDPQTAQMALAHVQDPAARKQLIDQLAMNSPRRIADMNAQAAQSKAAVDVATQQQSQAKDLREQGQRAFGIVTDQNSLNNWQEAYGKVFPNAPTQFTPDKAALFTRSFVPTEKQPEYDIQVLAAKAMQSVNPQSDGALVDGVIAPSANPALNQRTKGQIAAIRSQVHDPKEQGVQIANVLKDASDQIGRTETAVATTKAEGPIKIQEAVAQARAMMGTGPTANVPPHLAQLSITAYEKAGMDYANAKSSADEMQTFIDLARGGNKLAYAYAPTTGVLTINSANGTKRVNMAEIGNYAGTGSAWDKVQGFFGKQVSGASIPSDILDAMEQTHGALAQVAKDKYANGVKIVNSSYGSNFQPVDLGATKSSAPPKVMTGKQISTKKPVYSTDGGKTWLPGQPPRQ